MPEDIFSPEERAAWDAISVAYRAVQDMDSLVCNENELAQAVHVMQEFVKQHLLHRLFPNEFSDWWGF